MTGTAPATLPPSIHATAQLIFRIAVPDRRTHPGSASRP